MDFEIVDSLVIGDQAVDVFGEDIEEGRTHLGIEAGCNSETLHDTEKISYLKLCDIGHDVCFDIIKDSKGRVFGVEIIGIGGECQTAIVKALEFALRVLKND